MNLTPDDVDLIRCALRVTASNDKRTAEYDKQLPQTVRAALRERASTMGKLADRLKPHAPPELPEADTSSLLTSAMETSADWPDDDRR